jgi:enoyl-CoA hydratase
LSAATYSSDVALDRGWIDEIAEPADLVEDALAVARELAELSPAAFAQTKRQIRAEVSERMERSGASTDAAVTEIWCAPETHARIRDYVARTLAK